MGRILRILQNCGIETEEAWTDSGVGTICSVRITIKGTNIGQNGKGTDRALARASGYAEFMERLQTGFLLPEGMGRIPGTVWLSGEEAAARGGDLLAKTLLRIRHTDGGFDFLPLNVKEYLEQWSFDANAEGKISAVPFQKLDEEETAFLPENILRAYYFTNGSCAGNCREEALIQGLSEIAERFATNRILSGRLTPPQVPDEAFDSWPILKNAVESIRRSGRFRLRIMDASCGMGLPVLASALSDTTTGKTVLRFGAHPRFEIALERCLTEILQGRQLKDLEDVPVYSFSYDAEATEMVNRFNLLKTGSGFFTAELFGNAASWEYSPFEDAPKDMEGQLRFMRDLFARLGWDIYVRDCSFTGFPVFQIISPGVSIAFDFGSKRLAEKRLLHYFRSRIGSLAELKEDELREIRKLLLFKRQFIIENTFPFLSGLPVFPKWMDVPVSAGVLAGICDLALGETEEAARLLAPFRFDENGRMTKLYPLAELLVGKNSETTFGVMQAICPEGWAEEARKALSDPRAALAAVSASVAGDTGNTSVDISGLLAAARVGQA